MGITRNLEIVWNEFNGIYTREEFENQVNKINDAADMGERAECVAEFYGMIGSFNEVFRSKPIKAQNSMFCYMNPQLRPEWRIDTQAKMEACAYYRVEVPGERTEDEILAYNDFYEELIQISEIPTAAELKKQILEHLLDQYHHYPQPSEQMEQIVDYQTGNNAVFQNDNWTDGSLRLRILKQFIKYGDCLAYWSGEEEKTEYIVTGRNEIRGYIQRLFHNRGIEKKQHEITDDEILDMIDEHVFDIIDLDKILEVLEAAIEQVLSEGKNLTIQEIQEHCSCSCDSIGEDVIENYLKTLKSKYKDKVVTKELLWKKLKDKHKDKMKPRHSCELLRAADELANGRFSENTKKYLYLFAMVYGMTYRNTKVPDHIRTDVELELFRKYYIDEPQRYLQFADVTNRRELNGKNVPPSGQGCNRKNFQEMIYLYFIHKPFDSRADLCRKVIDSDRMIRRVQNQGIVPVYFRRDDTIAVTADPVEFDCLPYLSRDEEGRKSIRSDSRISVYRSLVKTGEYVSADDDIAPDRDYLHLTEENFETFVRRNYNTIPQAGEEMPDGGRKGCCADEEDPFIRHLTDDLVQRNADFRRDSWEKDTLRLRILKQFCKYGEWKEDQETWIQRYETAETDRNNMRTDVNALDDDIFLLLDPEEIKVRLKKEFDAALAFERTGCKDRIFGIRKLNAEEICRGFSDRFCVAACDQVMIQSVLNDLIGKPAPEEQDIEEAISTRIDKMYYETALLEYGELELLKAADALATGMVTLQDRRFLYWYAMVYDMTFHVGDEAIDPDTDIEYQLFRRYDAGCRFRVYSEKTPHRMDPTDLGICWSDFSDMIYLYYLEKACPGGEKIHKSEDMIWKIRFDNADQWDSMSYADKEREMLRLDDERFERRLRRDYNCFVSDGKGLENELQQNTAFREYQFYVIVLREMIRKTLTEERLEELKNAKDLELDQELNRQFSEVIANEKKRSELERPFKVKYYLTGLEIHLDNDAPVKEKILDDSNFTENYKKEEIDNIKQILSEADRMLNPLPQVIRTPRNMNRNVLLGAYYYCWKKVMEDTGEGAGGFGEMHKRFALTDYGDGIRIGANAVLQAAGYQPINFRNMIDVLVELSLCSS